jgi:hypothetical protein
MDTDAGPSFRARVLARLEPPPRAALRRGRAAAAVFAIATAIAIFFIRPAAPLLPPRGAAVDRPAQGTPPIVAAPPPRTTRLGDTGRIGPPPSPEPRPRPGPRAEPRRPRLEPAAEWAGADVPPITGIAPIVLAPLTGPRIDPGAITVAALSPVPELQVEELPFTSAGRN